jgi:biotin carboxylase
MRTGGKRILLIAPHGSYRTTDFIGAAHKLGVDVLLASEGKHSVVSAYANGLHVDFKDSDRALRVILEEAEHHPYAAIIGTDDDSAELAAAAAHELGLPHNPAPAVKATRRKDLARAMLLQKGMLVPHHRRIDLRQPLAPQCEMVTFPCVLKPLALSASRGVIRTDNPEQFLTACGRIGRLLDKEKAAERDFILAEDFIPGFEVAVEGMLTGGKLEVLAIFDKPEPLDGPYFEESYYITPSRLSLASQSEIRRCIGDGCAAYGLREGPVHAECRVNDTGVWILEIAARTIGGHCGRLLSFGTGFSLEEWVLTHAMGQPLACAEELRGSAGVLMIPTPAAGILRRVEGVAAAQRTQYIEEVCILVREGYRLVPWPEGSSYPGFIFARAPTPEQTEAALRQAHDVLEFVVAPLWDLHQR